MKTKNVGVKYPEVGTPPSVDGRETRPAEVAVGVGEGVAVADGVAVKAGS